jgi:hypothetical protein
MRTLLALLLAAHAGAALAQYKCTSAAGAITFQQTPCIGAKTEEKLNVVPNGHPPPASGVKPAAPAVSPAPGDSPEGAVDKRMLAKYERQRQRDALAQELQAAQEQKSRRSAERLDAASAVRKQYGDDPANAQALRQALADLDGRYKALGEIDDTRVHNAELALKAFDTTATAR